MKKQRQTIQTAARGFTLAELMVAIALTVMMLVIVGMAFRSAGKASGKAQVYNDMMLHVRVFTQQLDRDFAGLMTDMPMVIMFENHTYDTGQDVGYDQASDLGDPDDPLRQVRYDRIVFFSRGDFQSVDGSYRSSMARIFYGQSADTYLPEEFVPTENLGADPAWYYADNWQANVQPPRKILARKCVLNLTNHTAPYEFFGTGLLPIALWNETWPDFNFHASNDYDHFSVEHTTAHSWLQQIKHDHRRGNPFVLPLVLQDHPDSPFSWVRRPHFNRMNTFYQPDNPGADFYPKAMQEMLLMYDVTDFRISLWFDENSSKGRRWLPWHSNQPAAIYLNFPGSAVFPPEILTHINRGADTVNQELRWFLWPNRWPSAIRFTFTVYDKNRKHFPEGQTFSYIVEVPER